MDSTSIPAPTMFLGPTRPLGPGNHGGAEGMQHLMRSVKEGKSKGNLRGQCQRSVFLLRWVAHGAWDLGAKGEGRKPRGKCSFVTSMVSNYFEFPCLVSFIF